MIQSFRCAIHPIRSIIHQQPRLLCKTASIPVVGESISPLSASQARPQLNEPDKLYKKLEIELKGLDPAVLKSYNFFATTAAQHLGIETGKCWAMRKAHHKRMTLLKSVFIYKKHRVQYEIRTHYRFMHFHRLTGSTLDTFLEYIQRNLPEGVAMKATRVEVQSLPQHLAEPPIKV